MMAGAMLQAAKNNMVIMVDGFIATSALLAAYHMDKILGCHKMKNKYPGPFPFPNKSY